MAQQREPRSTAPKALCIVESKNNSLRSVTGNVSQMQLENNVNAQAMANDLSTITNLTNELKIALLAIQHQLAVLLQAV